MGREEEPPEVLGREEEPPEVLGREEEPPTAEGRVEEPPDLGREEYPLYPLGTSRDEEPWSGVW